MLRTTTIRIAACAVMSLCTTAMAQQPVPGSPYVGGQMALTHLDLHDTDQDANLTALVGRAGVHVNRHFSFEGRAGFGVDDDALVGRVLLAGEDVEVDIEIDYLMGGYLRGHIPIADLISLYGVVGVTNLRFSGGANGGSETQKESSASWGAGIDLHAHGRATLSFEYMRYLDKDDFELNAFGIGFGGRF